MSTPNGGSKPGQEALDLLPDDLKEILKLELDLLEKSRSRERDLLAQAIQAENTFWQEWGPLGLPREKDYSQEERGRAEDWLKKQMQELNNEKARLQKQLVAAQDEFKSNKEPKVLEAQETLTTGLLGALRALQTGVKREEGLAQDLEQVKTNLSATIKKRLTAWRDDRKALIEDEVHQEDLAVQIEQIDKKLQYLQQDDLTDVLIQRYLEQQAAKAFLPTPKAPNEVA